MVLRKCNVIALLDIACLPVLFPFVVNGDGGILVNTNALQVFIDKWDCRLVRSKNACG